MQSGLICGHSYFIRAKHSHRSFIEQLFSEETSWSWGINGLHQAHRGIDYRRLVVPIDYYDDELRI